MSIFTFLSRKQIFEFEKLSILKKYGTSCAITDFAILLGGYVSDFHTSEGHSLKDRTGRWWTKTPTDEEQHAHIVCANGLLGRDELYSREVGARPVLPYSLISSIATNNVRKSNGILEVEYGEYPQTVVSKSLSKILEKAYLEGTLNKTGNTYTTDCSFNDDSRTEFQVRSHTEFEYNGKRYIRYIGDHDCKGKLLSDGRRIKANKPYWVEVEPIKWMIDEENDIALSKKILFSGVLFKKGYSYKGSFDETVISKFMDTAFSRDIIPNRNSKSNDLIQGTLPEVKEETVKRVTNPYRLDYGEVDDEEIIRGAIESGIPVFLHGDSLEDKRRKVKEIDPNCIIVSFLNTKEESLNGEKVYDSNTGKMVYIKPSWLIKLEDICEQEPYKSHIILFEEIAKESQSIYNIVLNNEVNGIWKLPNNARIVFSGNNMNECFDEQSLEGLLLSRCAHVHIEVKQTIKSWLQWASEHNIHPAICSYIASLGGDQNSNVDLSKWEMASKMLYATRRPEVLKSLFSEDIINDFITFCNQEVITLDSIITSDYTHRDIASLNPSEKYATIMGLTDVEAEYLEIVREFVNTLGSEYAPFFDAMWTHGDNDRLELLDQVRLAKVPKQDNKN